MFGVLSVAWISCVGGASGPQQPAVCREGALVEIIAGLRTVCTAPTPAVAETRFAEFAGGS